MKRRLFKLFLWTAGLFLLFSLLVISLALFTPLPDRIARHFLQKALKDSGATLAIREQRGALVRGVDLYGVDLEVPGQVHFTAEHAHVQLRVLPLVAGVIVLRDTLLEKPHLVLNVKRAEAGASKGAKAPHWLVLSARGCTISGGHLEVRKSGELLQDWPDIESRLDASLRGEDLSVRLSSLQASAPSPWPRTLRVSGLLTVKIGKRLRFDVKAESPHSAVGAKGSMALGGGKQDYHARLSLSPIFLPEAAIGWKEAPPLSVTGTAEVSGTYESVAWKANVKADGLGPVTTEGKAEFSRDGGEVSGMASTTGASLTPFWKAPKGREAHITGRGSWNVTWSRGSVPRWWAKGNLGKSQVWGLQVDSASLEASGSGASVELKGGGSSPVSGPMEGTFAWSGDRKAWSAHLAGPAVPLPELLSRLDLGFALPSPLKYPEGAWNVASADLSGDPRSFQLQGSFQDPPGTHWDLSVGPVVTGQPFEIAAKASGLDPKAWNLGAKGRVNGEARFHGASFQSAMVDGRFQSSEWAGLAFEPFSLRIHLTEKEFEFDPFEVEVSGCKVKIGGSVTRDSALDLGAEIFSSDLTSLKAIMGDLCPSGTLQFKGRLSGHALTPTVDGRAWMTDLRYGSLSVTRFSAAGRWDGEGQGTDVTFAWEGLLAGKTNLGLGDVRVKGSPAAARIELFTDLGAQGRHLKASSSGRFSTTQAELDLEHISLQADVLELDQEGKAHFSLTPEAIAWSGLTLVQQKSRVSLSGRLALDGPFEKDSISGSVHAEHVPLKLLPLPPTAGTIGGHVDADLTWAGTIGTPVLTGQGAIEKGSYRFPDGDLTVTPITARFTAKNDRLVLTEATATTAEGGSATATGHMAFKGFLPADFHLAATGKAFPFVVGRSVQGKTDFAITIKGTLDKPVLDGSATVVKGRIQLPEIARQQPLPSSVRFVNAPPGSPLAGLGQEEASSIGNLRGAVHLLSHGDLWISNRSLLAELTGELVVKFRPDGPAISGALNLGNGRYIFQGKKFEIQTSRISFSGTTELDPYVDLNALYRAGDTDVYVHILGPADHPELKLTSSPPMDEGDILSVLLFGQKQKDLNSSQSKGWSLAALSIAGKYQSNSLLGSIQSGLGLETLDVGSSSQGGTEVGFSKYLGDKVVVEYRQTFGSVPEQRVNVRYRVNRHVSLQADSSSAGKSGADVFWEQVY